MPKGYWVSVYPTITDPEGLDVYNGLAGVAVKAAGGRVLASIGSRVVAHEAGIAERVVLIEFDSFEQAVAAYESAAYQEALKKLTVTVDGVERQAVPWPDWMITTAIDTRPYWPTVWKAVSCHDSQIFAYERLKNISPEHHQALWGSQSFYRAVSMVNGGREREHDLFDGIRP